MGGGLALTGLRPIIHSYAPFLVVRSFEQIKLDLTHQGVSGVLVSVGASDDWTEGGRTHQCPGDVALLDSLPDWTVYVPGHPDEVPPLPRTAVRSEGSVYLRLSNRSNAAPRPVALAGLRDLAVADTVVLVEPYLAGTSTRLVDEALADRPHRTLALGVGRAEQRRYGAPEQHDVLHGLDATGLRRCLAGFLR